MTARILTKETKRFILMDDVAYNYLLGHSKFGAKAIEGIEFENLNKGAYIWTKGGTKLKLASVIAKQFIPKRNPARYIADCINGDECDVRVENLRWVPFGEGMKGKTSKAVLEPGILEWAGKFMVRLVVSGSEMTVKCDTRAEASNVLSLLKKEFPWQHVTDIRSTATARPVYLSRLDARGGASSSAQARS